MLPKVENAENFLSNLFRLADRYEGQPVAIVADGSGGYEVGVLNSLYPTDDDWCLKPVDPIKLVLPAEDTD